MAELVKYLKKASEMGAVDVKVINRNDIVFDARTYLKCMYGCDSWGKGPTCPSAHGALKPWETEKILSKYSRAILIHTNDKKLSQEISLTLELMAFFDGFHFAFSSSDCAICRECSTDSHCRNPKKARPSMQALGIDVFSTVLKLGLPLKPLRSPDDRQDWYSLVFID